MDLIVLLRKVYPDMRRSLTQLRLLILTLTITCAGMTSLFAQKTKPYQTQVSYQKSVLPATVVDLPYPADVVEESIKDYMGRQGWKSSGSRGFRVFKNIKLDDTARMLHDMHIRVEKKSSRDNANSIVTILTVNPNEDPATRTGKDEELMSRTAAFVERMLPAIEAGDLEDRIKNQESDTKKAQNKLGSLHDDQGSLEKKIRDTEDDLKKNKEDQIKETQAMQSSVKNDDAAMKKSHKKLEKLMDDQASMQKKLVKYQADLEQNKKNQEFQRTTADQQQKTLDSLKSQRKH